MRLRGSVVVDDVLPAEHLLQGPLIDADADLALEQLDIFALHVAHHRIVERTTQALAVLRRKVGGRLDHSRDAEDKLLTGLLGLGTAVCVLGGAEDRVKRPFCQRRRGRGALDLGAGLNLEILGGGRLGECGAAFDLVEERGGLGAQAVCYLVLTPAVSAWSFTSSSVRSRSGVI
jgi:hypothetical protein